MRDDGLFILIDQIYGESLFKRCIMFVRYPYPDAVIGLIVFVVKDHCRSQSAIAVYGKVCIAA